MIGLMFVIGFVAGAGCTFGMYCMVWQQLQDDRRRIRRKKKKV